MTYHPEQNRVTALLHGAHNRILDIVDMQRDFVAEDGALGIHPRNGSKENASTLVTPMNAFFRDLPEHAFQYAFVKFDTHFRGEYGFSPESDLFPNIHCSYGTPGWRLAVDITPLTEKYFTYMFAKNVFDMWGSNPTGVSRDKIVFTGDEEKAYDNLFKFIRLHPGQNPALRLAEDQQANDRDDLIARHVGRNTVVVLAGVASDFCDYKALMGYLQRGATVIVAGDLTAGIGGPGSVAPETGTIRDVVKAVVAANPEYEEKLLVAKAADILASFAALSHGPAPALPKKAVPHPAQAQRAML